MIKYRKLHFFILCILCIGVTLKVSANTQNYQDYRSPQISSETAHMQIFHLKNAQDKINKQQYAYAWGDLAYLLCQVPNHHTALNHMIDLAPRLAKQDELKKYFENALKIFPEDDVLQAMYTKFLESPGTKT